MTEAMIREGLISILSDVTSMSRETVEATRYLKDLKAWDSLSLVEFILGADEVFSVEIQPKELRGCVTIDDLMQVIRLHQERTTNA
jgi:acyl carrier protein